MDDAVGPEAHLADGTLLRMRELLDRAYDTMQQGRLDVATSRESAEWDAGFFRGIAAAVALVLQTDVDAVVASTVERARVAHGTPT